MSTEAVVEFFEKAAVTEDLRTQLLEAWPESTDEVAGFEPVTTVANRNGFECEAEEIALVHAEISAGNGEELSEDQLDAVSGGVFQNPGHKFALNPQTRDLLPIFDPRVAETACITHCDG